MNKILFITQKYQTLFIPTQLPLYLSYIALLINKYNLENVRRRLSLQIQSGHPRRQGSRQDFFPRLYLFIYSAISQAFGKTQYSQHSEEMTIKSVAFTEEETIYRINYWEIPSRIRNAEYTFRYSLGCTTAIYMFDVTKRPSF